MSARRYALFGLAGLCFVLGAYLTLCRLLGLPLLEHSVYDSYTLQALAWLDGRIDIVGEYPYLEIAIFNARQYISFPPFPSLVMLPLAMIFGEATPSRLVSMVFFLGSYCVGFSMAKKARLTPVWAMLAAAFLVTGANIMEYGLYGGVWNLAQVLAFFLTLCAFRLIMNRDRLSLYLSLIFIAFAVGCRPFQALYAPCLALFAFDRAAPQGASFARRARAFAPMLIAPLLFAFALGAYNFARFGNPFEFGHNYLPEFQYQSEHGQFSFAYVAKNLKNVMRLPWIESGRLTFPRDSGFAFYLCNPMFIIFATAMARVVLRREATWREWIIACAVIIHFFLLMTHKSLGGVQFGVRYLCDLIGAMYAVWMVHARRPGRALGACWVIFMLGGMAINLYGAWWFHAL